MRSLWRPTLQPGNSGREVQRLFNRRPARNTGFRSPADSGKYSAGEAAIADTRRCRLGISAPRTIGGDAFWRRGTAHQTGARVEQTPDGAHALLAGRTHHRIAL